AHRRLPSFPTRRSSDLASSILTNNIQVTLLAFGFGLTAGIGTAFVLITNGIQLGAVAGWMTAKGNSSALWGWIMPHGGTELLARSEEHTSELQSRFDLV